ncbi:MAG: hypothetical protein FD165_2747 [Gammaproteobacteria bacterium]|nr:MAG: hypothetical protein FD165_2747 [Gammaproteobacteria bacterium]TND00886.1 MAG: hypothetical protein FD120_2727 [Gammaproteobacteria bacterium]
MTGYEHEKEQIDEIRKWWRDNGKSILVGAVLGIAGLIGWQSWTQYQKSITEAASAEFALLMKELNRGDNAAIHARGGHIVSQLGGNGYADAAALALAKTAYQEGDLVAAKTQLQRVIDTAKVPEIGHIARLRLARLLLDGQQYDEALKVVEIVAPDTYASLYEELKGDVYFARGENDLARTAYTQARTLANPEIPRSQLQMKLDDLGAAAAPAGAPGNN